MIAQNFVAFSEYMNFKQMNLIFSTLEYYNAVRSINDVLGNAFSIFALSDI